MATYIVTLDDGTVQPITADLQVNSANGDVGYVEFISATSTPQTVARFPAVNVIQIVKQ